MANNLEDAMKAAQAGSLARRPTIANAATQVAPMSGGQFSGRRGLGNGARIKLDRIESDPDQPRKTFGTEADDRLSESLRIRGQLVPILVRWVPELDRYRVIDGDRRFRAAQRAGLSDLAVVVEDESDPAEILELQLVTNALREDVAPVEQARAWERLMKAQGLSHRELAAKLGYDHTMINKSLALLDLTPAVQELVDAGKIPASTAVAIAKRLELEDQQIVVDQVVAEGLSRTAAVEVADRVARKRSPTQGKGSKAKSKALPETWKFRGQGGIILTAAAATKVKGIDPAALVLALEAATEKARAERDAGD